MTVEDGPGNSNATCDPHTQDITPYWSSILSMIDLSYGLQPFAHIRCNIYVSICRYMPLIIITLTALAMYVHVLLF